MKGEATGKVYFWDHELTNGVKDTFLVSNSFRALYKACLFKKI
ncbi:hypothetical protein [Bacillus velezensis]|nr:hypothetical protein HS9_00264 [Bacillus velezensis]